MTCGRSSGPTGALCERHSLEFGHRRGPAALANRNALGQSDGIGGAGLIAMDRA